MRDRDQSHLAVDPTSPACIGLALRATGWYPIVLQHIPVARDGHPKAVADQMFALLVDAKRTRHGRARAQVEFAPRRRSSFVPATTSA